MDCAPCPFLDDVPARLLSRHRHEVVRRVRQLELV
jgi:hypothetical protein